MNIILLGGNGYLGREVTKQWLAKDSTAVIYTVSRSGKNKFADKRVINLQADVSNYYAVEKVLPEKFDYIVDFVGRPEKDAALSDKVNTQPALVMKKIAEKSQVKAMGFIGGLLGPKHFLNTKAELIATLQKSPVRLAYVTPTLIYGADRNDSMSKMVPFLKFFGLFSKSMKPVRVEEVASELIDKLLN